MNALTALVAALAAAGLSLAAQACELDIGEDGRTARVDYRPTALGDAQAMLTLTLENAGESPCSVSITRLAGRQVLSGPSGGRLPYQLTLPGASPLPASNGASAPQRTVAPGETLPLDLVFSVPAGRNGPPGLYEAAETLRLFGPDSAEPIAEIPLALSAAFEPFAAITLAGASPSASLSARTARVDFGEMRPNANRFVLLSISGNSDYAVELVSLGGGRLENLDDRGVFVPYRTELDGVGVDLSQATEMRFERPGLADRRHRLSFTLPGQIEATAGRYRDLVTVSVAPVR